MHLEPIPGEKGARLVFGLEWRAYATKGASAERRRYAEQFDATHYVELKTNGETIGGFCNLDPDERKGLKLYSAAARIALLEIVRAKPAVLVLIQNDQRVHFVHVLRGAVSVDEDIPLVSLDARRVALEDQCAKINLPLVTLGHGAQLHDVDEPFPIRELLAARKTAEIKKVPVKLPVALPLLVIACAGFFGVSKAIDFLNPPPPPAPPPPTYMQEYQTAVARAFAAPTPLASVMAPRLLAAFGGHESNTSGWQFWKATCNATGPCKVTYKRQGGTFKDFDANAPEGIRPVVFNANGSQLDAKGPQVSVVERVALAQAKTWPTSQALIKALQTEPQKLSVTPFTLDSYGYVVDIKDPELILPRQPAPGDVQGPLILRGQWEIDGYKWQAPLLARLPDNMALDSLDLELKEDGTGVHFTAKGKYYAYK